MLGDIDNLAYQYIYIYVPMILFAWWNFEKNYIQWCLQADSNTFSETFLTQIMSILF